MKILFHPASGRWGNQVAFESRYGQALRNYVVPRNGRTAAQQRMRRVFGSYAQMWGRKLSRAQRDLWNFAGPQVMSHPRLGQRGPLTGQQHFEQINCVLACVACNARKANRTPEQASMKLRRSPVRPAWKPLYDASTVRIASWSRFLSDAYWNVPLEDAH